MRMKLWLTIGIWLIPLAVPAVELTSEIKEVVAYQDRAQVTRVGAARLPAGPARVVFPLLPPILQDESVRVRATGPGTIFATRVNRVFLEEERRPEVETLRTRLEGLRGEKKALEDEIETINLQRKFVSSIQASVAETSSREMLHRPPTPEEWRGVLNFIGASDNQLAARSREIEGKRRELDRRIEAAEKELRRLETTRGREAKAIEIALESSREEDWSFEVSYLVPNAAWRPSYDIRADRGTGTVEFVLRGEVRQKSGEDWEGVKMTLSTARPALWGYPPRPVPWHIGFTPPAPIPFARMKAAVAAGDMMLQESAEAEFDTAEAQRVEGVATFIFPRPQSVPSDDDFHSLVVSRWSAPASFTHEAFPRLSDRVYLKTTLKNDWGFPLLPGKINLFLGGDFVGSSRLDFMAPGQEASLYVGVDEEVRVKRELVAEKTDTGGLLRGRPGRREFQYRITVSNHRPDRQTVTVYDQIPVSQSPDIKVELTRSVPSPVDLEELVVPGLLSWKLDVGPGETKNIEFEFRVEFPRDKEVDGL